MSAKRNGSNGNGHALMEPEAIYVADYAPAKAMLEALAEFEAKGRVVRDGLTILDGAHLIGEAAVARFKHPRSPQLLCIRPLFTRSVDGGEGSRTVTTLRGWEPCVRAEEQQVGSRTVRECRPWRAGLDSQVLAALEHAFGRLTPGDTLEQHRRDSVVAEPIELEAVAYSRGGQSLWVKWLGIWHSAYRFPPTGRSAIQVEAEAMRNRPRPNAPRLAII